MSTRKKNTDVDEYIVKWFKQVSDKKLKEWISRQSQNLKILIWVR